jgi:acyl carrier protein
MTLNIRLNGSNYVSERTQAAFQEALEEPLPAPAGGNGHQPEETPAQSAAPPAPPPSDPQHAKRLLESLERGLSRSFEHQNETLQVHQQYLSNQAEYASIFSQLMAQQGDLFAHGNGSPQHTEATLTVLQSLARSIEQFHQHQTETLRVHNQFLSQQANYAEAYLHLLQGYADAPVPDGDGHGHGGNGYGDNGHGGNGHGGNGRSDHAGDGHDPAIAAPQALSAVPAPSSAPPAPSQPSEPVASAPTPAPSAAPDPAPPAAPEPAPDPAPPAASEPALDAEALSEALLDIVSDKTGYPAEMLELDMDMEADLGIDSIKRVEILGALQDAHPHLPEVETEALAELRTLGQVVDYVHTAQPEPTAKKV